jgi:hypothetical protein
MDADDPGRRRDALDAEIRAPERDERADKPAA